MREKILSMILALSMLCAFVPMTASAETYENYLEYWVNEDNTVTISKCAKEVAEVNIPSEIEGATVTEIDGDAFFEESNNPVNRNFNRVRYIFGLYKP